MSAEQVFTFVVLPLFIGVQSVFSGLFLRVGHAKLSAYLRFRTEARRVTGTVAGSEAHVPERPGEAPATPLYWVLIDYTADDGRRVRARSDQTTGLRPTVGEAIDIAYVPDRPDRVQIVRSRASLLIFGGAALVVPAVYLWFIVARLPPGMIALSLAFHALGYWGAVRVLGGGARNDATRT